MQIDVVGISRYELEIRSFFFLFKNIAPVHIIFHSIDLYTENQSKMVDSGGF